MLSRKGRLKKFTPNNTAGNNGKLVTMKEEKTEVLNIFTSVFTGSLSSYTAEVDGRQEKNWENKVLPRVR